MTGNDDGATTLHRRIRADIEGRIFSGQWPPGYRIPFEHELMETYSCSRMTVNKVLSGLAAEGLIERRRRAGSFVARPRAQSAVLHIPDIRAEIEGRGERYDFKLLARRKRMASAADRAQLGIETPCEVLALRCLHSANGRPFAYEERLLNLDVVPQARNQDFTHTPPGTWLLAEVPWTEAEHRISACAANAEIAGLLAIAPGDACLVVERRTWRAAGTNTAVRVYYPGERFHLVARFTPQG
jgi:GntR family histidine utilization transcriptional repressor